MDGDKIVTDTVDNLGYGYIGINAETVNVGGEPASEASRTCAKALATVIAAYREVAIDSYYGERASVINYPISNTSWAAPQKTDNADYKVALLHRCGRLRHLHRGYVFRGQAGCGT